MLHSKPPFSHAKTRKWNTGSDSVSFGPWCFIQINWLDGIYRIVACHLTGFCFVAVDTLQPNVATLHGATEWYVIDACSCVTCWCLKPLLVLFWWNKINRRQQHSLPHSILCSALPLPRRCLCSKLPHFTSKRCHWGVFPKTSEKLPSLVWCEDQEPAVLHIVVIMHRQQLVHQLGPSSWPLTPVHAAWGCDVQRKMPTKRKKKLSKYDQYADRYQSVASPFQMPSVGSPKSPKSKRMALCETRYRSPGAPTEEKGERRALAPAWWIWCDCS